LTGVEKRIAVTLPDDQAQVIVDHFLTNRGIWPITLAPWAITQLKPGGFAILPQAVSDTGLLPNRRLALWPCTDFNSPYIQWDNRYIFVHANMQGKRLKIGWANPAGWLGYWIDDTLFVKTAAYSPRAAYYDFGSSSECYCDPRFLELETLGPKITLEPDEQVSHREVWMILANLPLTPDENAVADCVDRFGIGTNELLS
jgi:hypothetical protein